MARRRRSPARATRATKQNIDRLAEFDARIRLRLALAARLRQPLDALSSMSVIEFNLTLAFLEEQAREQ